ncbi:MAG: hypothetical protein KAI25_15760, partial [Hyphomicrobiaceae bacterium]|nr:hypothetical protein [Hyphomicrobiaceae bacterium]
VNEIAPGNLHDVTIGKHEQHVVQIRSCRRHAPSMAGDRDTPLVPEHLRTRAFDWGPIRGGQYGQRSCELIGPHPSVPCRMLV